MATTTEQTIVKHFPASEHPQMSLDITVMEAARHSHVRYNGSVELKDPTTRRLLEDILGDKQQHALELRDWLAD